MAIITRFIAAASVLSLALVSTAPSAVGAVSVADHVANRAAHNHHAAVVKKSNSDVSTKNGKRCKARTTTTTSAAPKPSTTAAPPKPTTTSHKAEAPKTTAKAAAPPKNAESDGDDNDNNDNGGSSSSTPSNPPSSSGGKPSRPANAKWLAWSNGEDDKLGDYKGIGGIYSWGPVPASNAASLGLQTASMLWGTKSVGQFQAVRENYQFLMGMNEVNLDSQSGMSVSDGIALWNKEVRPYGNNKYLVAPSVTTAPDGFTWLDGFFAGCGGNDKCGVDAMSAHVYGKTAQDVIDYCTNLHNRYGKPVWLSEFACTSFGGPNTGGCSSDQSWAFMEGVLQWAESTDWIHMYSPFGAMHDLGNVSPGNSLMAGSGAPSSLGYYFLQH